MQAPRSPVNGLISLSPSDDSVDCGELEDADDALACSDWISGPLLVDLDLLGGTTPLGAVLSPVGTFDSISFDISIPDGGDPEEEAYLAANPDMTDISIRIAGAYNGNPFDFALDLTGDQEIALEPPMVVTDASAGFEVQLSFDVATWFFDLAGVLIDPASVCPVDDESGCDARDLIEANVEASIQSYVLEEGDDDGDDDDTEAAADADEDGDEDGTGSDPDA